jgi:hypothetical protein
MNRSPVAPDAALNVKTSVKSVTIYALVERMLLKRAGKKSSRLLDTYVLTELSRDQSCRPTQTVPATCVVVVYGARRT